MAKNIAHDVTKDMKLAELQEKIVLLKKEQMNLRFQLSQGQSVNTSRIKQVRRQVARAKTFMQQTNVNR